MEINTQENSPLGSAVSRADEAGCIQRPKSFYEPGLDILRCIAFFLVFLHHALPGSSRGVSGILDAVQAAGTAGVCLFFALSAFLITSLLLREEEQTGTIHLSAFYVRRILRIWPLYFLALVVGVVLPHFYRGYPHGEKFIIPYLLMFGNWILVFHGETRNTILAPLWSISVEEQFYVIWPSLFLLWRQRGILLAAAIILPVAWYTDHSFLLHHEPNMFILWCNSFSQFQFFAVGGGLAVVLHRFPFRLSSGLRILSAAFGFGLLLIAGMLLNPNFMAPISPNRIVSGYLLICVACVALILTFFKSHISKRLSPIVYLGKISYGLYIFHMAVLAAIAHFTEKWLHLHGALDIVANGCLTLAFVIPMAMLSYEYFEKPFLRLKDRFTFVPSRST